MTAVGNSIVAISQHFLKVHSLKEGLLKKENAKPCSVSLAASLMPGTLTTLAAIVGIIALNVLEQPYLSINCGIGALAGGFTVYQGYYAHSMKSFSENNEKLKSMVRTLTERIKSYKRNIATFIKENQQLAETVNSLKEASAALNNENVQLTKTNCALRENIANLQATNSSLSEQVTLHMDRLEGLKDSLSAIQNATENDHTQFGVHVKSFVTEVQKLQQTRSEFSMTGAHIEKNMSVLLQTAEMLQEIFIKIDQWKDDTYVNYLIQTQQSLSAQVLELEKQLARKEGQIMQEQKNLLDLSRLRDQFGQALENFSSKTEEFRLESEALEKTVKMAADLNNYMLQSDSHHKQN